jgi:alpha-D-xyloside xylohydrolase
MQYTSEKPADPIDLFVYTGRNAKFNLYEDEDTNYNYEKGVFANIPITYNESSKTLMIGNREGSFPGMLKERTFRISWITRDKPAGLDRKPVPARIIHYNGHQQTIKQK